MDTSTYLPPVLSPSRNGLVIVQCGRMAATGTSESLEGASKGCEQTFCSIESDESKTMGATRTTGRTAGN